MTSTNSPTLTRKKKKRAKPPSHRELTEMVLTMMAVVRVAPETTMVDLQRMADRLGVELKVRLGTNPVKMHKPKPPKLSILRRAALAASKHTIKGRNLASFPKMPD